jgi:hypothetical protein
MADQVFAVLGLVFCALVWGGMWLGPARTQGLRYRVEAWWRRASAARRAPAPPQQPDPRQARAAADALIERARRAAQVEREGNVYRPDRFHERKNGKDGKDKLH